ncbi:hypothetical protein [Nonomuraea guangzhouensis]|uniref:Uncharacterized protein n=1 Tax=Nonomuraea guangzhouensis TaxID=1291555 RepID=A0ABW4GYX6_9ACTN|nr:hypothetical protein [Nonomuraea guangzhouensis]
MDLQEVEQQLLTIEQNALYAERARLTAAEDLAALIDVELAQMQQTLDNWRC